MDKYDINRLQDDVVDWADGISKARKPQNTVTKLVSEAAELNDAIINGGNVRDEIGDMIILLLDLAHMYDVDIVDAGWEKMDINRHQRQWTSENGVIRRVKNNGDSKGGSPDDTGSVVEAKAAAAAG